MLVCSYVFNLQAVPCQTQPLLWLTRKVWLVGHAVVEAISAFGEQAGLSTLAVVSIYYVCFFEQAIQL